MLSLTRCPFSLLDLPMRFTNDCRLNMRGGHLGPRLHWLHSRGTSRWSRVHRAPKVVTRSVLANRYCGRYWREGSQTRRKGWRVPDTSS